MTMMLMMWIGQLLLLIMFIMLTNILAYGYVSQEERKCKYLRVEKLLKIRCYDMHLKEVPQYLKTSVEILDLSFNRIKKLKRSSFQPYRHIKFLLLYENMIQSVEAGTFQHLTSLQEIDLSNNALMTIPLEILQLPSMRNLYMDSNDLMHLSRDLEALETPIKAPLEYLNVADCGLQDLPDLGILPRLWHINVSMNPLMDLSIERFANMCNLKSIDLTRTQLSQCQCQQVNSHLRYVAVKTKFVPVCIELLDQQKCPLPYNYTVDSLDFQNCKTSLIREENRNLWLFVAGCGGGVFIIVLFCWLCMYRRRKKRLKKLRASAEKRKSLVIAPKNAINNKKQQIKESEHDQKQQQHQQKQQLQQLHYEQNDELLCCDTNCISV